MCIYRHCWLARILFLGNNCNKEEIIAMKGRESGMLGSFQELSERWNKKMVKSKFSRPVQRRPSLPHTLIFATFCERWELKKVEIYCQTKSNRKNIVIVCQPVLRLLFFLSLTHTRCSVSKSRSSDPKKWSYWEFCNLLDLMTLS